ncbi:MAG: hypothetical protein OEV23_09210, partial [Gallionella sp.]|nr:hypothetical protein [Gallionella sp.]
LLQLRRGDHIGTQLVADRVDKNFCVFHANLIAKSFIWQMASLLLLVIHPRAVFQKIIGIKP